MLTRRLLRRRARATIVLITSLVLTFVFTFRTLLIQPDSIAKPGKTRQGNLVPGIFHHFSIDLPPRVADSHNSNLKPPQEPVQNPKLQPIHNQTVQPIQKPAPKTTLGSFPQAEGASPHFESNPSVTDPEIQTPPKQLGNVSSHLKCVDPEGKGDVQDTLCMPRPDYLSSYKNPCWIDWTGQVQRLRCLPYFHVLGVDKCGTTDLHSRIAQHPQVLLNSGGLGKETYYWCWHKYGQWMRTTTKPKPFFNYIRMFDKPAAFIANTSDSRGYHSLITGDGTPMDFWDFRGWPLIPQNRGLKEPAVLTPHLMKHVYENPKFIVILRNPVDRLYSDYIFLGYGFTPEKFRNDVPRALKQMAKCLEVNTTRQCVFSNHTYVTMPMRLHIGMYSVFMKEWLAVFPRETFYILRTEDYKTNMTHHLREIYKFLGLDPLHEDSLAKIVKLDKKHETKAKKKVKDMYPETRDLLNKFYSPYNRQLANLLLGSGYLWESGMNR